MHDWTVSKMSEGFLYPGLTIIVLSEAFVFLGFHLWKPLLYSEPDNVILLFLNTSLLH